MLSQPLLAPALSYIFAKMTDTYNCTIGAWQRSFLGELFQVVFARRGRVNFTNLARFSTFCEQTFRRHFRKTFQWVAFNLVLVRLSRHPKEPVIGVFDCSFLPKHGSATYGIDRFFSARTARAERGLEVSILGVVATESRRAFGLDATQTPPALSAHEGTGYSRVDFYLEQIQDLRAPLMDLGVSYWVGDGYYAKRKVFTALTETGGHLITRLRSDSNLRYLYTGPRKQRPGAPKRYDGKIDWRAQETLLRRFDEVGRLPDKPQVRILTTVANSPHFKRNLRIVLLIEPGKERYVVLCSTDVEQPAEEVVRYYRLRYQIEFVIRDAKQHTGLTHCQARSQEKIDFHLNLSVAGVNLLRFLARAAGCSLRSYRRAAYNRFLVARLFSQLGLFAEYDLMDPRLEPVLQTGRMAA
jgi:hypothetical protein